MLGFSKRPVSGVLLLILLVGDAPRVCASKKTTPKTAYSPPTSYATLDPLTSTTGKGIPSSSSDTSSTLSKETPATNIKETVSGTVTSTLDKATGYVTPFQRRPSVDTGMRYSSQDWLVNFISIPSSYIFRRIRNHWMSNIAIAVAVTYYYHVHDMKQLAIPMTGHTLLASSLGLLLSYRTNSAYARFWEARGHWTKTKASCRSLAIFIHCHVKPQAPKTAERMIELLKAYPSSLMHLCLGGAARLSDEVASLIPKPAIPDQFQEDYALPAMLLQIELHKEMHNACHESKTAKWHLMDAAHLEEASHLLTSLMDSAASCEKILRTPVPWTYSRHTSRFLTLWMGALPFALVGIMSKSLTVAVVAVISYCMFGIEEIAHLIEQPFLGDPDQVWSAVDADGEAADLMKRGVKTLPYDIGIPVCRLAAQIRKEIAYLASGGSYESAAGLVSL